jgi:hypothetical protein
MSLPGVECLACSGVQRLGRVPRKDSGPSFRDVLAFVAGFDHGFERHTVGHGAGLDAWRGDQSVPPPNCRITSSPNKSISWCI